MNRKLWWRTLTVGAVSAVLSVGAVSPASADSAPVNPDNPGTPTTVTADALPTVQISGGTVPGRVGGVV
ncbi:MAG: hypothetical protein FWD18_06465, partial [Micrococcales bacterium]|nr:hypothetical protein [Micrococcales bacterium]